MASEPYTSSDDSIVPSTGHEPPSAGMPGAHQPERPRRKAWFVAGIVLLVLLASATAWWLMQRPVEAPAPKTKQAAKPSPATPPDTSTPVFATNVLVSGRQHIWEIAFLPDKDILFTERGGTVNLLKGGQASEVGRIADVRAQGEGGLMGLAIDPDFKKNRAIYTCYSSTANDIRIIRWRVAANMKSLQHDKDVVTGMPANTTTYPGRHSGCRLAFGPDGYLWAGTGDTAQGDIGIQKMSLGGKILRIDRDGKAAPGNMGQGFDARVYSYGHRNVQGLAFFPTAKNGVLGLSAEHGPREDDEVNELKKGNFGWAPPAAGYDEHVPMTDLNRFPDAIQAIWSSGSPTLAPSGAAILHGQAWKGWDGALAVAMLKTEHVKVLRLGDKNQVTQEEKLLDGVYGRLRAVVQGPDGSLYVGSSNGTDDKIIKITPQ